MAKGFVGKVENKKFAFFWLLIGGSLVNFLVGLYSLDALTFWGPAVLSILIVIDMANKKQRPKMWLGADLLVTLILFVISVPISAITLANVGLFLPDVLIVLGCILGIMDW